MALGAWLASCSPKPPEGGSEAGREPNISPDYSGVVIPPNIAPLSFRILEPGRAYAVTIHSEFSESWHSWSSNSRWIAFSSKREGGLFTRTYFSYVDEAGTAHKPLVLPQQDPAYYDSLLETYSVPELVKGPVAVSQSRLARAARARPTITPEIPITGATPKVKPADARPERE
jgi:hypothetical protein